MKCYYFKDIKKRYVLKKIEFKKLVCLFLIFFKEILDFERYKIYMYFFFFKKVNINFELKNYCILIKNIKIVIRFLLLIRLNFKYLINWGMLNGIRKWNW